jgi:hypothetical protein
MIGLAAAALVAAMVPRVAAADLAECTVGTPINPVPLEIRSWKCIKVPDSGVHGYVMWMPGEYVSRPSPN